jgi:hypothetical protein
MTRIAASSAFAQILGKLFFVRILSNCSKICGVFCSIMGKNDPTPRTPLSTVPARLPPAAAMRAAGDVGFMFFLIRMAFWLSLVLILLPSGGAPRQVSTSEVGASDALSAASATVHDLRGFCGREPDACAVGSQLATSLGYRAQAGAKMLYDLLTEALAPRDGSSVAGNEGQSGVQRSSLQRASQDTLTPADLNPAWRGPPLRKVARHAV